MILIWHFICIVYNWNFKINTECMSLSFIEVNLLVRMYVSWYFILFNNKWFMRCTLVDKEHTEWFHVGCTDFCKTCWCCNLLIYRNTPRGIAREASPWVFFLTQGGGTPKKKSWPQYREWTTQQCLLLCTFLAATSQFSILIGHKMQFTGFHNGNGYACDGHTNFDLHYCPFPILCVCVLATPLSNPLNRMVMVIPWSWVLHNKYML